MNSHLRIVLLLLAVLAGSSPLFAQAGQSGLAFLKLGVTGRGVAMADAMAASVDGASSTYYNPAGLLGGDTVRSAEILFTHREWIQDTRMEFLAGSVSLSGENALGFAVTSTTVGDIEIRTRPGEAEGTFTARDFAGTISYARGLGDDLRLGASIKYLYEKILIDEASGIGVDLGAQYRTPIENLSVGAVIANLGGMSALRTESSRLPTLLRVGPAYSYQFGEGEYRALMAADLLHLFPEGKTYTNVGGEIDFDRVVAVRAGYQFGSEGRGLTAGFGVQYRIVGLQYAYAKLAEDLGNAHSFSVVLTF